MAIQYDEILARHTQSCTLEYLTEQHAREPVIAATLVEVSGRGASAGFEQFSLLFRAAHSGAARQGTYAVAFADGVSWEMFLVPVRREGADFFYEACFNRNIASAAA